MPFATHPLVLIPIVTMLFGISGGCRRDTKNAGPAIEVQEERPTVPSGSIDPAFTAQIHSTATEYFDYPQVDDRPHFAPGPCAPTKGSADYPVVRLSGAGTNSLHAEKLYYLYVKNYESYLKPVQGSAPVGQIIVKQGYLAQEITSVNGLPSRVIAERNGHKYTIGEPLALFIMVKLDEKTPHTDHGWIYGITDFDGEVSAAGVIEACANCHAHAAHDRIFGP